MDIYRQTIPVERNAIKFAFYLAFFPKLVSGPIERAGTILDQLRTPIHLHLSDLKEGLSLILMGLFLKLVLSDNIAAIINPVFASWQDYSGLQIALAVVLFAFQIYGDFGGYSYIALGSARILGFQLSNNFESPYHAESVSEFWTRWHITLNNWLRDYLYIPLGGNRKGTLRKYVNTMIVFLLSGLWHGAEWTFVIWGGLNGLYIIAENVIKKASRHELPAKNRFSTHLRSRVITFLLIDFAWLFFCMPNLSSALSMIRHAVTQPGIRELFNFGFLDLFPDIKTFAVITLSLLILLWTDTIIYREKISYTAFFFKQSSAFRWLISIAALCMIIFFGAYGDTYEQTQFIYFQF
ncbi:MAG: MBOAT family protein [Lachnospiraceae bacterium]|nr:MBOAT family protein [Lachnospiraceae bacterium]